VSAQVPFTGGRVVVVGSVNVDLVATVDRLPSPGETVLGASFARHPGGKGGNQATAAARLGAAVSFVGAVGDDALGGEATDPLVAEGIDVDGLARYPGPTGVALILVDARGENVIAVASGANAHVTAAQVGAALGSLELRRGDVVLVSNEIPADAVLAALRLGRSAGAITILNPAPATGLGRSHLEQVDILVPNRGELADLAAMDEPRTGRPSSRSADPASVAATLLEGNSEGGGVRDAVVVTLGADGAVLVRRDAEPVWTPTPSVEVVDSVGAGDTFVGALAAGLAQGRGIEEAVRRGVVAASLSTQTYGAREGMPSAGQLGAALGD
jgi:ribokinase